MSESEHSERLSDDLNETVPQIQLPEQEKKEKSWRVVEGDASFW